MVPWAERVKQQASLLSVGGRASPECPERRPRPETDVIRGGTAWEPTQTRERGWKNSQQEEEGRAEKLQGGATVGRLLLGRTESYQVHQVLSPRKGSPSIPEERCFRVAGDFLRTGLRWPILGQKRSSESQAWRNRWRQDENQPHDGDKFSCALQREG